LILNGNDKGDGEVEHAGKSFRERALHHGRKYLEQAHPDAYSRASRFRDEEISGLRHHARKRVTQYTRDNRAPSLRNYAR
jgi:hypothetical protein